MTSAGFVMIRKSYRSPKNTTLAVLLCTCAVLPKSMQADLVYNSIIDDITRYFEDSISLIERAGIDRNRICFDPGIGFSKNVEQNLFLLNNLSSFTQLGRPLAVGTSRKSFIGKVLNIANPNSRSWGTAATIAYAICRGANIIRVHEVAEMQAGV